MTDFHTWLNGIALSEAAVAFREQIVEVRKSYIDGRIENAGIVKDELRKIGRILRDVRNDIDVARDDIAQVLKMMGGQNA